MNNIKNSIIIIETIALVILLFSYTRLIPNKPEITNLDLKSTSTQTESDETEFPPLNFSPDFFEPSSTSTGNGAYSIVFSKQSYQSYPTTLITLSTHQYSTEERDLPFIKPDEQIYTNDPMTDHLREAKQNSIKEHGDLARRYVGSAGESWYIDSITEADIDTDGTKEKIISIITVGANIIGKRNIVVKNNKEIFSSTESTFSDLVPAINGNGFFLEWEDNFKKRDGFVTTRFIFEDNTFKPIYEQKVRYIRIQLDQ